MKRTLTSILLALFAFAGMSAANADYFTAAYVDSDLNVDSPYNTYLDDDANGFLIGYGWETPHSWLFVEMAYTDFGDSSETTSATQQFDRYTLSETLKGNYEGRAIDLMLVGRFSPFDLTRNRPIYVVPRVGLTTAQSFADLEYTQTYNDGEVSRTNTAKVSADDTGVGYMYGIGLEVANVIQDVDVYLDWRQHEVEMVYLGERVDFDPTTYQLGINWHF